MNFTSLNNITLHYRYTAPIDDQPVVVFSNSLGTDFRIWDGVVPGLSSGTGVLLYDQRGHGLSGAGESPYQLQDHVKDLIALMESLDIKEAVVVGLSVGGMIAQLLATMRPDLVRALVLCDTAHRIGTQEAWNERIAAIESGGIASICEAILERWFTPLYRRQDNAEFDAYRHMLCRQDPMGYIGTCAAIRDADLSDSSATISVPTLCIVGDQDGSTPPTLVQSLADLVPEAEFVILEGAGHLPCIEQPRAFTEQLRNFLDKHVTSS